MDFIRVGVSFILGLLATVCALFTSTVGKVALCGMYGWHFFAGVTATASLGTLFVYLFVTLMCTLLTWLLASFLKYTFLLLMVVCLPKDEEGNIK